jgi:hypothetical protein
MRTCFTKASSCDTSTRPPLKALSAAAREGRCLQ